MVNGLRNMKNLREVEKVVKKGKNKQLQDHFEETGRDTRKNMADLPNLSVNIFSMTRALTKGFNLTPQKESLILKKNTIIMKLEEHLYHGNGDGYILATGIYAIPDDYRETKSEGKKTERKNTMKLEGMIPTIETTPIKHDTEGKI